MTNSKHTKRALLSSVLALLLCFTMLLGTTFAWFTDTASTSVNEIKSGTLKVDIVDGEDNTLVGKSLSFHDKNGETNILWEPNATFETGTFNIKNNGNLALKYKIEINGISGDSDLLKVITFTVVDSDGKEVAIDTFEGHLLANAKSDGYYRIKAHMDENAGNAYQGLTLEGVAITVSATQDTVEKDITDESYDAKAEYATVISDDVELNNAMSALATAGNSADVVITDDVSLEKGFKVHTGNTLNLDFNGNTISASEGTGSNNKTNGMQLLQDSNIFLENGTYKLSTQSIHYLIQNYSNLTIKNMTLSTVGYTTLGKNDIESDMAVISSNCGDVTITGNTQILAETGTIALDIMHWESVASYNAAGSHVTFDANFTGVCDGRIVVYCYRNNTMVNEVDDGGATLTIMGGTFKNTGLTLEQFKAYVPAGYTVTENNGAYVVTAE